MNDRIQISPEVMRAVADQHDGVADRLDEVRAAGTEIHAAVASYGPIMHQVKAAVADLLGNREATLLSVQSTHRNTADNLRRHATNFVAADELNAERLRLVD
jgi:hypothetical protein